MGKRRRRTVEHGEGQQRVRLFKEHRRGRDDGPSDNTGNLHGVFSNREHRADYKERGPDGLPIKRSRRDRSS